MPSPRLSVALCAVALLAVAGIASQASDTDAPMPLSTAPPDAAVLRRIAAFEAGTGRWDAELMSFWAPGERPIYLVIAPCCDQFNRLYDGEGRYICSPSGGFGGSGDGSCPPWTSEPDRWRRFRLPGPRSEQPWPPH